MRPEFSVILLAAGVGRRLGQDRQGARPKVLLEFGGKTLMERHLALLARAGATEVTIVTGFKANSLEKAVMSLPPPLPVRFVRNPRYREGSVVSLAKAADRLRAGGTVVLMDGDVLYDGRMHPRLLAGVGENILLLDRDIEPGDEPVKICFNADGRIVDFRKRPEYPYVRYGESVGFFRFSPAMAAGLADRAEAYAVDGRAHCEYEEAIRDLLLVEPERFRAEDISDLPWTEIDFPEDVVRARDEILPQLEDA
jgi:choline kinase